MALLALGLGPPLPTVMMMTQEGEIGMRELMKSELRKGRSAKREAKGSRRGREGGEHAQRGGDSLSQTWT
jgi:hypothetical protein